MAAAVTGDVVEIAVRVVAVEIVGEINGLMILHRPFLKTVNRCRWKISSASLNFTPMATALSAVGKTTIRASARIRLFPAR